MSKNFTLLNHDLRIYYSTSLISTSSNLKRTKKKSFFSIQNIKVYNI